MDGNGVRPQELGVSVSPCGLCRNSSRPPEPGRGRGAVSLAVTGSEDDRFGRHSRPLLLMGRDVPRWTAAQPGSLAPGPACPLTCRHKPHNILSEGGSAALLAPGAVLRVIWPPLRCLRGLVGGNRSASARDVVLTGQSAQTKL